MYWSLQHLRNLPDLAAWTEPEKTRFQTMAMVFLMLTSIAGNFLAGAIARVLGYRKTISLMCVAYFLSMFWTYHEPRSHLDQFWWLAAMGISQGVFALFTMYLPPLFPDLVADHRGRLLLQHRPTRRRGRDGVFRAVCRGGRLPTGVAVRGILVPACRLGSPVPFRTT